MPYSPPKESLSVTDQINNLLEDYKQISGEKLSYDRENLIKFIWSVRGHNAILGSCIYGLLKIEDTYRIFSADKGKNILHIGGSGLYQLLKKILNIYEGNKLDDQSKLMYLVYLYEYLKNDAQKNKDVIIELESYFKRILGNMLNKNPSYLALRKTFLQVAEDYKPSSRLLGFLAPDPARNVDVTRIKVLDKLINETYPLDSKEEKINRQAYMIHYGALLYTMSRIEAQYLCTSPEHSSLYRICQRTLGIKKTLDVPKTMKKKCLHAFIHFVSSVQSEEVWKKANLESVDMIEKALKCEKTSYLNRFLNYVFLWGVNYGVQMAVGSVAGGVIAQYQLSAIIISKLGSILAPPEYRIIIDKLAPILEGELQSCIVKFISGSATALVIEPVGKPLILLTCANVGALLRIFTDFTKSENSIEMGQLYDIKDFIKILHFLPESIFTQVQKDKMQYLVGFNKNTPVSETKQTLSVCPL